MKHRAALALPWQRLAEREVREGGRERPSADAPQLRLCAQSHRSLPLLATSQRRQKRERERERERDRESEEQTVREEETDSMGIPRERAEIQSERDLPIMSLSSQSRSS